MNHKPAELPVEQPTKFEFVINLKIAKQIGLSDDRAIENRKSLGDSAERAGESGSSDSIGVKG